MKNFGLVPLAVGLGLAIATPACASEDPILYSQYLPKATISATITETLLACPVGTQIARVRTLATIDTAYTADLTRRFDIKPKSGLLSSISLDLELYDDGRLKSVNAASEGAGGEIIGGLFKAIANIGLLLASAEPVPTPPCRAGIATKIDALDKLRTELARLQIESQLGADDKTKAAAQAKIAPIEALIAAREKEVTLTTRLELAPMPSGNREWVSGLSDRPAYDRWLQVDSAADWAGVPPSIFKGKKLYALSIKLDDSQADLRASEPRTSTVTNGVAYIQPPAATATVCVWDSGTTACGATLQSQPTTVPQAAPAKLLAIKSSAFGNRGLSASFGPNGAAIKISYKSSAELKEMVAAMNGAAAAGATIRDRETQDLVRATTREEAEIKLIELRKKKAGLLAPAE